MKKKIVIAAIFLMIGFFIGFMANSRTTIIYEKVDPLTTISFNSFDGNYKSASIMVPAVDEEKKGLVSTLTVEIVPGSGRILSNIDKMLFYTDTQNSIRTARQVAVDKTGIDISKYDFIYTLETNATAIEGPSAGAAFTVVTIAALTNRRIKEGVMLTGAINHDGTIGRVSNVMEKAVAAGDLGVDMFLVPLTQGSINEFETRRYCEEIGNSEICLDEDVPKRTDLSELSGIEVIEVVDIDDVMEILL